MTKDPVCVLAGEESSLMLKPRLVKRNGQVPAVVIDVKMTGASDDVKGIRLTDLWQLERFMTDVYDWRRVKLYGERK